MTDLAFTSSALRVPNGGWPASIVCGVDGTAESREAVLQAAALVAPGGRLELRAVTRGHGFPDCASAALAEAERLTAAHGLRAGTRAIPGASIAAGLIRAATAADVLVVGCGGLGSTPLTIVQHAPCSVLLARRPPDMPLLATIMVAEESAASVHARAAQLASRHGGETRQVPEAKLSLAAQAIGAGLIVAGDGPGAIPLARAASCSVLIVRPHR